MTSNTTYTGKVITGVKDINGNVLQTDYIWTFLKVQVTSFHL
ncbi:MAG: hypothetical protein IPL20_06665 [Saprospiraceae bacterium]|nr:hypothetical protein [Saprospiraceae bacterium]